MPIGYCKKKRSPAPLLLCEVIVVMRFAQGVIEVIAALELVPVL